MRISVPCLVLVAVFAACPATAADTWTGGGPDLAWVTTYLRPTGPGGPLYAGTYGGGIWRSDDDGATWREATETVGDAVVWDLAASGDIRSSLYAATEDRGVLRNEDGGSRWSAVNAGLADSGLPLVFDVETFPFDPRRIVAGTSLGTFVSRTRGSVWEDSLRVGPVAPVRAVEVLPERPRTVVYLVFDALGLQSGDTSTNREITAGLPARRFLFDLAPWPASDDSLVVADFEGSVWQLRDRERFVPITPTVDGPRPRYYRSVVVPGEPRPTILVGADRGLFRSSDGGTTWQRSTGGRGRDAPEIWEIHPDDQGLLLGSFVDGVLREGDDGLWSPSNTGLRAAWVRSVAAASGRILAGTAHGRVFRSDDGAASWTEVTGDLVELQIGALHVVSGRWLLGAAGGVYTSDDEGETWIAAKLPRPGMRVGDFASLDDGRLLATSDSGPIASDDDGRSWSRVEGLPDDRPTFALTVEGDRAAVGYDPQGGEAAALYVGDGRSAWGSIPLPDAGSIRVRGLAFRGPHALSLLVAVRPGPDGNLLVVEGLDAASRPTVTPLRAGPAGEVVEPTDLLRIAGSPRLVLATSAHGVFVSDDGGSTWGEFSDGLDTPRVEDLAFDPGPVPRLAAGTLARGAYARDVDTALALDDAPADGPQVVPAATRLLPAAPNPFNPRTSIRWEQAHRADVRVDLFDLRGRRVRSLLQTRTEAGRHGVTWDGTDDQGRVVASGSYLVRLRVGARALTGRVTLVR
ncbi:MAG TPA: FlgD immunoglobulin-like domain containing protein [Candidatus Krumholzibacteria bacterium]|nr:FlgD immunoglobulin-like domain containing protein [Candidatus Krumholzibacteria bacterium]